MLLGREPGLEVCGQASRQDEALKKILALKPELIIVDLVLDQGNGLDLIRELRAFRSGAKILAFSMHCLVSDVRQAMRLGANGYVPKEDGADNLAEAIHEVMLGRCFLSKGIAHELEKQKANSGSRPSSSQHR